MGKKSFIMWKTISSSSIFFFSNLIDSVNLMEHYMEPLKLKLNNLTKYFNEFCANFIPKNLNSTLIGILL